MSYSMILVMALAIAEKSLAFECGMTKIAPITTEARIVGGIEAIPHSWPWQVAICRMDGERCSFFCGGTIINNKYILTAAHCIYTDLPHTVKVKANTHRLGDNGRELEVARIIPHPEWDEETIRNDIGLIELIEELEFTETVSPICLPYAENGNTAPRPSNKAIVMGWGLTSENGQVSQTLQQVSLPFVSRNVCRKAYGSLLRESNICLGNEPGKDSCTMDSGGPAIKESNGRWYQYGVVSFGEGCARMGYPGVYARVISYCDFIAETVGYEVCVGGN